MTTGEPPVRQPAAGALGGVSLRHLMALDAIARERSFGRAAERLGYVQSAISQQLADLERLVGARLVDRTRGNALVSLTSVGHLLRGHAETVMGVLSDARADLEALSVGAVGTLRVGAFHSVATTLLPRMTAAFAQANPGFRVEVMLRTTDIPLLDELEAGRLDLAFGELPAPGRQVESVELMEDPVVLLVARDSALLDTDAPVSLGDLKELPLIGYHFTSRFHAELSDRLAGHGFSREMAYRVDLNSTLRALVAADLGVAIVPRLTIDGSDAATVAISLPELSPRRLLLFWPSDRPRPPASHRFEAVAAAIAASFA